LAFLRLSVVDLKLDDEWKLIYYGVEPEKFAKAGVKILQTLIWEIVLNIRSSCFEN